MFSKDSKFVVLILEDEIKAISLINSCKILVDYHLK